MSAVGAVTGMMRMPLHLLETSNIILTTADAVIGAAPRDIVWTHRKTTLYRYRSDQRTHRVPILLAFALINRPEIFDLRPGNSFVEFLLDEGFDVFLVDWGVPDDEDSDMGIDNYVCDELHWAVRETTRATGSDEVSLVGWCIGATLSAMYAALHPQGAVRNLVLLTTPVDTSNTLYKLMKPVTNYVTTQRRLFESVVGGPSTGRRTSRCPSGWRTTRRSRRGPIGSGSPGCTRRTASCAGRSSCAAGAWTCGRSPRVCWWSPRARTISPRGIRLCPSWIWYPPPFMDLVSTRDKEHLDRPRGHIGLMAGSKARKEIWPDLASWLANRSS